jgi:hypothetical protein
MLNPKQKLNPKLFDKDVEQVPTRKGFGDFIYKTYRRFNLPPLPLKIDMEGCNKENKSSKEIESFLYQQFVKEYLNSASPYRGLLVYHGLGSGKTCSAITAAEAIFGSEGKEIIILTPASLKGNFQAQISFCGFKHFRFNNYWVKIPIEKYNDTVYTFGKEQLNLSDDFLMKVTVREDKELRAIWLPDFEQDSNYDSLPSNEQTSIRAQINHMLESRIKFMSYNGISAQKLKELVCNPKVFDNKVIKWQIALFIKNNIFDRFNIFNFDI